MVLPPKIARARNGGRRSRSGTTGGGGAIGRGRGGGGGAATTGATASRAPAAGLTAQRPDGRRRGDRAGPRWGWGGGAPRGEGKPGRVGRAHGRGDRRRHGCRR